MTAALDPDPLAGLDPALTALLPAGPLDVATVSILDSPVWSRRARERRRRALAEDPQRW